MGHLPKTVMLKTGDIVRTMAVVKQVFKPGYARLPNDFKTKKLLCYRRNPFAAWVL